MSEIAAGTWPCKVIDGFFGDNDKNLPVVRINVEITDGPAKGQRMTYDEVVDNKQAPYIARTCKAVGWRGRTLSTLKVDAAAWILATGGTTTVQVKHIDVKRGKQYEKWVAEGCVGPSPVWVKVGGIGIGLKPLKDPSKENLSDADEAMRRAMSEEPSGGGDADFGGYGAPDPADADIPFISQSMLADRDPVRSW